MDVGLQPTSTSAGGSGSGDSSAGGGGAGAGANASSSSTGGGKSKGGKKGKGKKGGSAASSSSSATGGTKSSSEANAAAHAHAVDYVDLLDVPPWKRRMTRQKEKAESSLKDESNKPNIIVDDVVLATLKVTLLSSRLYETLAQLFSRAADAIGTIKTRTDTSKEELCSILQENYFAQIRLACTYPRAAHKLGAISLVEVSEKQTWEAEEIATAYESAQLAAMALARQTGSRLHQSWVASAALLHHEANADAVKLMEARLSSSSCEVNGSEGVKATVDKLKAKNAMLPRLAESLMSRVVSREGTNGKTITEHPPSAEDWNLYLDALMEQDKCVDALEKLEAIQCASGGDNGTSSVAAGRRRIDDETDVTSHEGSLIQLAHREKLEKKASLCMKLQRFDEARDTYTDLIALLPDNWSYWIGFLRASMTSDEGDARLESGISMCRQAVEPYISTDASSPPLRGSHLLVVELAAIPLRGIEKSDGVSEEKEDDDEEEILDSQYDISKFLSLDSSQRASLLHGLGKSIIDYGTIFAPRASCCFHDLRKYIGLFATVCHQLNDEASECWGELLIVMGWAKRLREDNCFQADITDAKVRRRRLRAYICSIQITFGIVSALQKCDGVTTDTEDAPASATESAAESLSSYLPSVDEMVNEWQSSLDLGSNPKDGGQKEVLPGDELILLACQLACQLESENGIAFANKKTSLIASAALLEAALHHSPYNPHLMIAAIGVYDRLSAGHRALELFEGMGVKQIQYDSCSYLIFPTLIRTGLYREAVQLAGNIMGLHWSSAKDVQDYATKCCETGVLSRCREMITWQRQRMTNSLQLLAAKSTVMDLASLVYSGEPDERGRKGTPEPLGARRGICGSDRDFDRVGELIASIGNFSAAPSIVNIAMDGSRGSSSNATAAAAAAALYSDNRDFTVNRFHILSEATYMSRTDMCVHASTQAHWQGILMRAALMLNVVKAPKKGKAAKVKEGDMLYKRCKSLSEFIRAVESFLEERAHGRTILNLARVLCVVATGMSDKKGAHEAENSLNERENIAAKLLQDVQHDIGTLKQTVLSATPDSSGRVCVLLPEAIVPIYALLQMIATEFAIFGWGKSKGRTKAGAGALASAAQELQDLVMDMLGALVSIPTDAPIESPEGNICTYLDSKEGKDMLDVVSKHVERSHIETRQRVMPFCDQIIKEMESFAVVG
mmetsp:Transcript_10398/g.29232  ORF Transcript_10398/g.29232 Transcript_10398/m.29232 type:complete len:1193 (+) Transcript_10398:2-3580(+)